MFYALFLAGAAGASAFVVSMNLTSSTYMNCGSAHFCGVLALESGDGPGNYHHEEPGLHGLWPQVDPYGDSPCVSPEGDKSASVVQYMTCYTDEEFAEHEWTNHGYCAASTPDSFFTQACDLSYAPLKVMTSIKDSGGDIDEMATTLETKGYEVWSIDNTNSQVSLVVCAGSDKKWKFSSVSTFKSDCGK